MRVRHLTLLAAGLLAAFAVARFPALAANQTVTANSPYGWSNPNVVIGVGETVTWTNPYAGMHNVCVRRTNVPSGCDEFHLPSTPSTSWPADVSHTFPSDGTYTFYCEYHAALMKGTITVGTGDNPPVDTGTGTSTTPPPTSQPTDTITYPTPTQTQTTTAPAADTTKPAFSGSVKRRASRTALIITLSSSEDATLNASVFRRPPQGRSFSRISRRSVQLKQGKNVVTLIRKLGKRRAGAYRVKLQLEDAAGNKSATKTLNFKIA
jgi:plastocyanin